MFSHLSEQGQRAEKEMCWKTEPLSCDHTDDSLVNDQKSNQHRIRTPLARVQVEMWIGWSLHLLNSFTHGKAET